MAYQPHLPSPPRIACWLLSLFTPAGEADPLVGDLFEEFSLIAIESGLPSAQIWFWRQTLGTIIQLIGLAFRTAPAVTLALVLGGLWSIGWATRVSVNAAQAFGDAYRLYESHPDAYLFLSNFPLTIGRGVLCCLIAVVISLIAKRRELPTTIALALAQMTLFFIGAFTVIVSGREWLHWFLVMVQWNTFSVIATVTGGVLVKLRRSGIRTSRLAPH